MKFYTIARGEIDRVGETSFDVTLYFSLGSFFLSQGIGGIMQVALASSPLTPEGQSLLRWICIISFGLTAVFLMAAFVKLWRKGWYSRLVREEHGEDVRVWPFAKGRYADETSDEAA